MGNKSSKDMINDFRNRVSYVLNSTLDTDKENKKRFFTATQNHFNFYSILYMQNELDQTITFAEINNDDSDSFQSVDIRTVTDGDLNIGNLRADELLSYFDNKQMLPKTINWTNVLPNSVLSIGFSYTQIYVDTWLQKDFNSINNGMVKKQFELIKFNTKLLNRSTFDFENMINEVSDPQFTNNLNQILGAYNNGWFYVSASAIGGLIEMLLYKTAVNYGKDNFDTQRDKITKKNYVKKMHELRNFTKSFDEDQQIHFDSLDELTMDRDYLTRNAVSHYTTGFVNEREVESLFVALSNTYIRYFVPSKHYAQSHL